MYLRFLFASISLPFSLEELSNNNIVAVFRQWTVMGKQEEDEEEKVPSPVKVIKNELSRRLSARNLIHIS